MIQALLVSINFEKQNGMWERGKPRALTALWRATVRREAADSEGEAGRENGRRGGTWGQLSQEDTRSAALFGAGWRSPRLSMDSPRPCHTSCGFSRVPVSVLYVTPEDRLLFPRVQWVSVCSVKASLVPSLHQSFLQACVCSVFIQCSNPQMIAQGSWLFRLSVSHQELVLLWTESRG